MASTVSLQSPSLPLPNGTGGTSRIGLKLRIETNKKSDDHVVAGTDDQTIAATVESNSQELVQVEPPEKERKKISFSTFSVSLTREKTEADILAMGGGSKRMRRMSNKRRTMSLQRKLDDLFPGLRLKSITTDD